MPVQSGRVLRPIHLFFSPPQVRRAGRATCRNCHCGVDEPVGSMNLDLNTLFLVTIYVEAILGLLLLFAWVQNAQIKGVAYWGFAHLLRAGSVVLFGMYGSAPPSSPSTSPT